MLGNVNAPSFPGRMGHVEDDWGTGQGQKWGLRGWA